MIKWVIVTNKTNHDNKDTFKITTSYYYDGMGNKVMTISEADPAQIAAINIRCNRDADMLSLYSNCVECIEALGLEANYYGREAGGKTLALYNTDPNKGNVADIYLVGYDSICSTIGTYTARRRTDG